MLIYQSGFIGFFLGFFVLLIAILIILIISFSSFKEREKSKANIVISFVLLLFAGVLFIFWGVPKALDVPHIISKDYSVAEGQLKDVDIKYSTSSKKKGRTRSKTYHTHFKVDGVKFKVKGKQNKLSKNSQRKVEVIYLPHSKKVKEVKLK